MYRQNRYSWLVNKRIQGVVYRLSKGKVLYVGLPRMVVKRPMSAQPKIELKNLGASRYLLFCFEGKEIKLFFEGTRERDARQVIGETFFSNIYDVDVSGKDVLDVGANIGDTAIYFALKGARRVIAMEPFPSAYRTAVKNVFENNVQSIVEIFNEGMGSPGKVKIDATRPFRVSSQVGESDEGGVDIPVRSLKGIVDAFGLHRALLKVDCEGCEYPLLLRAPEETLKHFDTIILEYHYGKRTLVAALKRAGFSVHPFYKDLVYSIQKNALDNMSHKGYLVARRWGTRLNNG